MPFRVPQVAGSERYVKAQLRVEERPLRLELNLPL